MLNDTSNRRTVCRTKDLRKKMYYLDLISELMRRNENVPTHGAICKSPCQTVTSWRHRRPARMLLYPLTILFQFPSIGKEDTMDFYFHNELDDAVRRIANVRLFYLNLAIHQKSSSTAKNGIIRLGICVYFPWLCHS